MLQIRQHHNQQLSNMLVVQWHSKKHQQIQDQEEVQEHQKDQRSDFYFYICLKNNQKPIITFYTQVLN